MYTFEVVTLKRHLSIGGFVVYVDTGSPVPNIPSKSRRLVDENKVFDRMEMIRNNRFKIFLYFSTGQSFGDLANILIV
jgi:hypothetical protein